LPMAFRILTTSKFAYPEVKSCKNSSYCTHTLYIVEMRNYIISQLLVISPVTRRIGLSLIKIFELNQSWLSRIVSTDPTNKTAYSMAVLYWFPRDCPEYFFKMV
jgi:hypothetical protein